ncbi:hypothetical protein HOLleu_06358 [Holothuria leucospilota]|uniref:Uncharacterized protein n=1 Tax=Holothuria leucospilota TaxID=206669 RepID=A0A9Q1CMY6_HOLLE|nr:hypothetical protein HOLleu_06358 [Holothuria leucospilota]
MCSLSVAVSKNILHADSSRDPLLKSSLYNIEQYSSGPILRVQHLVEDSRNLSTCEAVGEGLHRAEVGVTSSITVKLDPMRTQDFHQFFFSVLAVGEDYIFAGNPQHVDKNSTHVSFTFVPSLPGEYELYVEEIISIPPWQKQVSGSPFRLIVRGHELDTDDLKVQTDNLPSCQTISREDPSWVEGAWMTRKLTGKKHGVLRSGWVFQPKRCSFDTFTTDDIEIASHSKVPKTIAILGSSTERGIFLSLVDLALHKHEKRNLSKSDLSKCWGFVEFRLGNLHFIYQDFRVERAQDIYESGRSKGVNITCHNEKKAEEGSIFFRDALKFLEETLFGPRLWPDIIFVASPIKQLRLLLGKIPPSWNGTIYPVRNFKSKRHEFYNADGLLESQKEAKASLSLDPRVDVLDGFTLSTGMRHATESSPFITMANHFHRWCNELNGEMLVCGNPTEMVAQFLLGQVIAPKGKDVWMRSIDYRNREKLWTTTRTIRVCHDCPATLLPFHIKSKPDLNCYDSREGLHVSLKQNYKVWDGSPCPEECMKTKPVDKVYTQSGSADVRQCTVL